MKKVHNLKAAVQRGFTLIELIIVVAILGIIIAITVNAVRGTSDAANAQAISGSAKQFAKAIGYLHVQMGSGIDPINSALPSSGLGMLDVLMIGEDAVNTTYRDRYKQISMRPLEGDFRVVNRPTGSTPGVYQVLTYPVSFAACSLGKICVQYANVPSETVAELATKAGLGTFSAATAVTTGALRYTAAVSGFHTVTVEAVP